MEQAPIVNPPNPYVGTLRLFPGTLVKVNCRPRPNASRFAINFQNGPSLNPRDDLALHLSPCFSPPRVVRNSLINGQWGLEEAWGNGSIITPHQPFEFMILCEADQYKIAVNGGHYCEFRHRMPYEHVSHLSIDGDVDIERIQISFVQPASSSHHQPSAPPTSTHPNPPYPMGHPNMPMPSMYPSLASTDSARTPYPPMPAPAAAPYAPPAPQGAPGPVPTGGSYSGGYGPAGYGQPPVSGPSYPQAGPYPAPGPASGPQPTGGYYQSGYPNLPQQQHPQGPYPSASGQQSGPFGLGGKALGTIAGLGLGAAAGAAVLSAVNPLKHAKKILKPKKMFKAHGYGRSSSSSSSSSSRSSISSRGSFSSNSS